MTENQASTNTVKMPSACTKCGGPFGDQIYHVLGGHFHPWCVPTPTVAVGPAPIGCICPPGANRECERYDCPRKGWNLSGVSYTR